VFTLLLASLLLHESLTWQQWLAVATVFVGVLIAQRHKPVTSESNKQELDTAPAQ
jgi:drug/metabolite transporter (DMT)-like permease